MSKSFYFASEEELENFLLELLKTKKDFCREIFSQFENDIKQIVIDNILNTLETAEFNTIRSNTFLLNGGLILTENSMIGLSGTPTPEAFLRFDHITGKTLSKIHKLNVDELYIDGRKLNVTQTTSLICQLEDNPSWN